MITAREAIALTQESLANIVDEQIKVYSKNGKNSLYWADMPDYLIDELEKNGFVIERGWINWES